jgi:bacterioferritin (cytochrome b1)
MPADPRVVELFSYYRDAELHGAALLLRLMKLLAGDPDAQVKLTRHVAEETHHAWLWTKRITDLGGMPVNVGVGYQARIGQHVRPRTVADLLALTIVVETRSLARYQEHAARPDVDEATRRVLQVISSDEEWHLTWMRDKLDEITRNDPVAQERVRQVVARYRRVEEIVYGELLARERDVFGVPLETSSKWVVRVLRSIR